jgi:hypothetical protein
MHRNRPGQKRQQMLVRAGMGPDDVAGGFETLSGAGIAECAAMLFEHGNHFLPAP